MGISFMYQYTEFNHLGVEVGTVKITSAGTRNVAADTP
jgi:hypothetical protein